MSLKIKQTEIKWNKNEEEFIGNETVSRIFMTENFN